MIRGYIGSTCDPCVRILVVLVSHDGQADFKRLARQFGLWLAHQVGKRNDGFLGSFGAWNVKPSGHLSAWLCVARSCERWIFGSHGYAFFALVDESF